MAGPTPRETLAYDYPLPAGAIAQSPRPDRDGSRLLVCSGDALRDWTVRELPQVLRAGDLLVLNATRVRAARLRGWAGEEPAELLLIGAPSSNGVVEALVRPGRRLHAGAAVTGAGWRAEVLGPADGHPGLRRLAIVTDPGVDLEAAGEMPLPPYIRTPLADRHRYQTVFAQGPAVSAAAPTAGLHFTGPLLQRLSGRGIEVTQVTLTIGLATFAPIRHGLIDEHPMHEEMFDCPPAAAAAIAACRDRGGRVVAVGTTVVRVLESVADEGGGVRPGAASTRLYLRPGDRFRVVDGLLTNFHQPRSSLLVLVSAFLGWERARRAYRVALERGYRFLSFGDCMLAWRAG
ncbi:MAG TPA: tRNA preQ1(34) S-adenosylmethionine ribosyltransferase-isomerase QueA [Verrucomicrobiae bacterium]|nr:tRNA preQ1(34) S-adenosylmethionine ribosyltransferase-isomerase QueA [Verrucomicrobiae bacterium]